SPPPAPGPAGGGGLARAHVHLPARPRRAADVGDLLCLARLGAKLLEPRPVGAAGVGVEQLAGVTRAQVLGTAEIERMKLAARMAEQLEEIHDALRVLEPCELALARDAPEVALATEARAAVSRHWNLGRRDRDRGARRLVARRELLLQRDQPETSCRRRCLRFQRGGALAIAVRAQAAGELALRVRELRKRSDPGVRRERHFEMGDRRIDLPERVGD